MTIKKIVINANDHVRISKYKNIFGKDYDPNWYDFVLKKLNTLCCGHMLLVILTVKEFLECFTKNSCKRQIKHNLG